MATLGTLTEQCKRIIKGGNPSAGSSVKDEEIYALIRQVVNKLLRTDYFSVNLPSGETIPSGYVLASYSDIVVVQYKNRSRAKLPAIPILLPRNLGVFHVGDNDDPDSFYIPLPAGQGQFIKSQPLINDFLGKPAYEVVDGWVVFHKDITIPMQTVKVNMKLVVMDAAHYTIYDLLPVPADMEAQVIAEVVNILRGTPPPDKIVDSTSEPTKMAVKT